MDLSKLKDKKDMELKAVVDGVVKDLKNVDDQIFSQGILGKGIAIVPSSSTFYVPIDGEISSVFPTCHAYAIKMLNGVEILVHIGLSTVQMNKVGFESHVVQGQKVKAGDLLATADLGEIKARGFKTDTVIIITKTQEYKLEQLLAEGTSVIAKDDSIMKLK